VWNREINRGFELAGKTIGIVGLGNTGQSLVRKLSGWALDIVYFDPYVPKSDYIEAVSLEELQLRADIISLHVQLTSETRNLVDTSFINNCKKGFVLINTSRGGVVNTKDVVIGLENGQISGVCLDVFENEKPPTFTSEENSLYNKLYDMENVVLTPHVAGWTHESLFRIAQVLLQKIKIAI
jgi:D-3-phosphoglycerate dehydrogenase